MRSLPSLPLVGSLLLLATVACQSTPAYVLPTPRDGGSAGDAASRLDASESQDAGATADTGSPPIDCARIEDEAACTAEPQCRANYCSFCDAKPRFFGCAPASSSGGECPPVFCPSCEVLGELSCIEAAPGCATNYCLNCDGAPYFSSCSAEGVSTPCPQLDCPDSECGRLDEQQCATTPGCHRLFTEAFDCACASPGCCQVFERCAAGPADCVGPAGCRQQEPRCEGPYVVAYTDVCYEGCVLATDCN